MTMLLFSLDTHAGAAQRAAATQWWQSAVPQTQALWQAAFDAAQGAGGEDRPWSPAQVTAVALPPCVVAPARETLVEARIAPQTEALWQAAFDAGHAAVCEGLPRDPSSVAAVVPTPAVGTPARETPAQRKAPRTEALWRATLDAVQGAAGEDQPLASTPVAAVEPAPGVVTPARETPVQAGKLPQTETLWRVALDAAQGAGGQHQPLASASVAAVEPTPAVGTPARETAVKACIESMTTGNPVDGLEFAEQRMLLQDRTLATNALGAPIAQITPDAGSVAAASASLMDGLATSTASPKACGLPMTLAPTIRLASGKGPWAGAIPGAAMTIAQAATPFAMALTTIDGRAATPSVLRGAADLARGAQPITENGGARRQQALFEAQTDSPEESVIVFQRDHGIEIVVRHAALAPQAAVLCALETARHLSGVRKALHQVTLNGRTVYDNGSATAQPEPTRPGRAIRFSC